MDVPNIPELASELARILGPYLPYLVETGKKAGEKVAREAALAVGFRGSVKTGHFDGKG